MKKRRRGEGGRGTRRRGGREEGREVVRKTFEKNS